MIGGTPDRARTTFYHIAPASYFDLTLSSAFARNSSLRFIANSLLATRYDRCPAVFLPAIALAATVIVWL